MSAHRSLRNRRPLFVALGVVGCSACVMLALGTTAPDSAPIFNSGSKQATAADAAPRLPLAPSLIPLPEPVSTAGPATAAAVPASTLPASPTPYSSAYRSSFPAQGVAIVTAPTATSTPASQGPTRHSSGNTSTKHTTTHPTARPTRQPDPAPRPPRKPKPDPAAGHPTEPTGGSSESGQLPWWWWLVPHGPSTPTLPPAPPVPTIPRLPVPIHTTDAGFGTHGGSGHHDSGFRHVGRR